MNNPVLIAAGTVLLLANAIAIAFLASSKKRGKAVYARRGRLAAELDRIETEGDWAALEAMEPRDIFFALSRTGEMFRFSSALTEIARRKIGSSSELLHSLSRGARSASRASRGLAAFNLRFFPDEIALPLASKWIVSEKTLRVRLLIADSLEGRIGTEQLPAFLSGLADAPFRHISNMATILRRSSELIVDHYRSRPPESMGERLFLVFIARRQPDEFCRDFLRAEALSGPEEIAPHAARILSKVYPEVLDSESFLSHRNPSVRERAIASLARTETPDAAARILSLMADPDSRDAAVSALRAITQSRPRLLDMALDRFFESKDEGERNSLAELLSSRLDTLLFDILGPRKKSILELVRVLVSRGRIYGILSFLNRNRDLLVEKEILEPLRDGAAADPALAEKMAATLSPSISARLGLAAPAKGKTEGRKPQTKWDKPLLVALLVLIVAALGFWLHSNIRFAADPAAGATLFLREYMNAFSWYSVAINSVYALILGFSILEMRKQLALRASRPSSMLFKEKILPSISIIVPAYREEKTIGDSIRALLNSQYPDFEVIAVNDGSPDGTMAALVAEFGLERFDLRYDEAIATEPVRALYRNPRIPGLTVIDKENGGKADSLNAGINIASGEYVCGIDADSLLEPEALLRAMTQAFESDEELVAVGGNILPVNGCSVSSGHLRNIALPKNGLARFQSIEYIRSFLAGRLGWAYAKSLLIISGAFGIFGRKRVLEIGGYLTRKSRLGRDTVGEDMELVVRLSRHMREKRIPHKVGYSFDANCWTEVPEDMRTLVRQRNRWHRGLIEILTLHKNMIFNPSYGRIGLVAFPYFITFEAIGPFLETFGWIVTLILGILGLLDSGSALFLFCASVLYGILISVASLAVAENQVLYYKPQETAVLILYAIFENFGFRQYMSAIRVSAYFSYLFAKGGWGKMERKGFAGVAASTPTRDMPLNASNRERGPRQ